MNDELAKVRRERDLAVQESVRAWQVALDHAEAARLAKAGERQAKAELWRLVQAGCRYPIEEGAPL